MKTELVDDPGDVQGERGQLHGLVLDKLLIPEANKGVKKKSVWGLLVEVDMVRSGEGSLTHSRGDHLV